MEKLTFDPIVELAKLANLPESVFGWFYALVILVIIILVLLKGLSLWRSARNGQKVWFCVFMVINTLGILEIIYLLLVKPKDRVSSASSPDPIQLP